jgi:hypothetical protein
MSMAELMRVVASLPPEQQNELAAYLMHLRLQHDAGWRAEMTRRIDDKEHKNWVSLQELKEEFKSGEKK